MDRTDQLAICAFLIDALVVIIRHRRKSIGAGDARRPSVLPTRDHQCNQVGDSEGVNAQHSNLRAQCHNPVSAGGVQFSTSQ